ncbi:MAG: polysaccharide deacetylase family protein [Armatimonadota bacterium]|nr:polysaccharide deacetylase family protein [Armatimonadota bacterium]MCX7777742.1 polysaccharide deacetylase family protein [Armatimonadota bacterium]MDW8026203.1 polysaccharide deacetylase family protein [Armatimonadota bacterium]
MTSYVFSYDVEHPQLCIKALPTIVEIHRRYEVPATLFILGRVIEEKSEELRRLLIGDSLFDIQSHTYSHKLLKDNEMHGSGISLEEMRRELELGKRLVEEAFEVECIGFRTPCGFYKGMQGDVERLSVIWSCGFKFISSDARGPADSIPSGLQQAYWYDVEGFPQLLELPAHGWHDNVLKDPNGSLEPRLMLPWPGLLQWGIPSRPPRTAEEEFEVQRVWIDRALKYGLDYLSLVYHPHSIYRMSEDCRIIKLLIEYVLSLGMPTLTYSQLYYRYAVNPELVPGRDRWTWEMETQQIKFSVST